MKKMLIVICLIIYTFLFIQYKQILHANENHPDCRESTYVNMENSKLMTKAVVVSAGMLGIYYFSSSIDLKACGEFLEQCANYIPLLSIPVHILPKMGIHVLPKVSIHFFPKYTIRLFQREEAKNACN